ncbi:MAG: class I SAM-dependent methyltransferase [Usitatibacter sp.]
MNELPFTGERFVPGTRGEIWVEHWHRYHFAARWVAGKRVLDVACGEGYGSALLARHAAHVTGVDLSAQAITHAKGAYAGLGHVEFLCASCAQIPIADASIDVAVSFETIEHIAGHAAFLDELARVLKPGGVLILSCPNKLEYSDKRGFVNEFHVKELYREELAGLVGARFPEIEWYGQRPSFFSVIAPEGARQAAAQVVEVTEADPVGAAARLANPLYFLLVASRQRDSLTATAPALSVLSDRDDWVHRDYEKVMRDVEATFERNQALGEQMANREGIITELKEEIFRLRASIGKLEASAAALEKRNQAQAELHQFSLAEKDREILRRRGLRWWLKLPLIRLGLLKE